MRAKLSIALSALASMVWAVPNAGGCPFVLNALYPFKITFDLGRRLIEFVTSAENN